METNNPFLAQSGSLTTDLLIVGGGMAAAELIRRLAHYGFQGSVLLAGEEPVAGYNRVLLPHYLANQVSVSDLSNSALRQSSALAISFRLGVRVETLDTDMKRAQLSDGTLVHFACVVLALGSAVVKPPPAAQAIPGVMSLRTWADADALQRVAHCGEPVLFVGGGLLGLEAADAVLSMGCPVTLIQRSARLMPRQIDAVAAGLLVDRLRAKGVEILLGEEIRTLRAEPVGVSVTFKRKPLQQRTFAAVVLATGCVPRTKLARAADIPCERGITVDTSMASPRAGVFALGECAEVEGTNYQLVEPIYQQAEVLAQNLCGIPAHLPSVVQGSHLKVDDVPLFFAGTVPPEIAPHDAVIEDSGQRVYRRLFIQDGVLRGAVLFGDTLGARDIQRHINTAISPSQSQSLAFGLKAA